MASEVKTNKVSPATGVALSIGDSGDTITVPSGATLDISASTLTPPATMPASSGVNLTALNATNLGSGTVPTARLGSGTASSSTFLTGAQTYAAAGGNNVPRFSVYKSAEFDLGNSTWTIVPFDTADINDDGDSGTCFNITGSDTNPRGFTVPADQAGQYAISLNIAHRGISGTTILIAQTGIYKGASGGAATLYTSNPYYDLGSGGSNTVWFGVTAHTVMDLAVGDHLYVYVNLGMTSASANGRIGGGRGRCQMNGFKLL